MRKLLLGVAAAMLVSGSAMGADYPVAPPLYRGAAFPPPPLPIYSWTGCYLGASAGGVWVRKQYTAGTGLSLDGLLPFAPVGTDIGSHDANSFIGVVQGGCNYQMGPWVVGAQADFGWANAIGSHPDTFFLGFTERSTSRSVGSVTGRVGYAWDRILPYVKGGAAWERDEYRSYITGTAIDVATASETRSGWTVGAGLEYGITINLSGFVEYDYYGFGTRSVPFTFAGAALGNIDIRENKHVVKAGLNWRFGPPAVAAY
jgi:outer membrane immunogenic protein